MYIISLPDSYIAFIWYIFSLPKIKDLNGSKINWKEIEEAERFYIRYFIDKFERPQRLLQLQKKHGNFKNSILKF